MHGHFALLTPEQIIEAYGERWSIESMFNQLKLSWGLKEAWQQTRQTLHRWVHLTLVGYGLIQLLGYLDDQTVRQLCCHSPWRKDNPTTAGQIRKGLLLIFHHVPVVSAPESTPFFRTPSATDFLLSHHNAGECHGPDRQY